MGLIILLLKTLLGLLELLSVLLGDKQVCFVEVKRFELILQDLSGVERELLLLLDVDLGHETCT